MKDKKNTIPDGEIDTLGEKFNLEIELYAEIIMCLVYADPYVIITQSTLSSLGYSCVSSYICSIRLYLFM